jgi:hypothetical protein
VVPLAGEDLNRDIKDLFASLAGGKSNAHTVTAG